MLKQHKIIAASILVVTIGLSSCGVMKNEVSSSAITGENATYIQTSNLNEVKGYYTAFIDGMDKALDSTEYTIEENESVGGVKSMKEILEALDIFSISSKSASYIDFNAFMDADTPAMSPINILKAGFATDQTIQMDSVKLSSIAKGLVNGMRDGASMTEQQIDELIEEFDAKGDEYAALFYAGEGEKVLSLIEKDATGFGSMMYGEIVADLSEEEKIELNEQLKNNIVINDGSITYKYDPNNKLGGSLSKNTQYNEFISHLDGEEIIYQVYFNYAELLETIGEENLDSDTLLSQLNSTVPMFAMMTANNKQDIQNLMDIILTGDSLAIGITKSENIVKLRIDVHSTEESREAANSLISNYKDTVNQLMTGGISAYSPMITSSEKLTTEQQTYLQEVLTSPLFIATYSETNYFTVGLSIDLKDENAMQDIITELTAESITQTFDRNSNIGTTIEEDEIEIDTEDIEEDDTTIEVGGVEETIQEGAANTADTMEKAGEEIQKEAEELSDTIEQNAEELSDDAKQTVDNISNDLDTIVDDLAN